MSFLLIIGCLFWSPITVGQQGTIILDGKGEQPAAMFVQDLLERAYQNLGYEIEYRSMPLARSWVEANAGRIHGLRARVEKAAQTYPNLVQVPYTLFDFNLLVIGDRLNCGACDLSQIKSIATVRGLQALSDEIKASLASLTVLEMTTAEQALTLLQGGRVDAVLLPDLALPSDLYQLHPHWIQHTLLALPDYHYLHKHYAPLAESVAVELRRLEELGEVDLIRERYGISAPQPDQSAPLPETIVAVSGHWKAATTEGAYAKLLTGALGKQTTQVDFQSHSWKRAKRLFEQGEADVLVGAYNFELDDAVVSDLHIDYQTPVMAFASDQKVLNQFLNDEQSVSVCYVLGYDFDQLLPQLQEVLEVEVLSTCISLFESGFVDVVVDYAKPVFTELGLVSHEIFEARPLFVAFQPTSLGKQLKALFEQRFRDIVVSGNLRDYYTSEDDYVSANLVISKGE